MIGHICYSVTVCLVPDMLIVNMVVMVVDKKIFVSTKKKG